MKVTKLYYKKLFSTGEWEHDEIGIVVDVESKDDIFKTLQKMKSFVESRGELTNVAPPTLLDDIPF